MIEEKIDSAKILNNVLNALNTNASNLANVLGYKSTSSIYHVINGKNNITVDMATKIIEAYPKVNFLYLLKGEGEILKEEKQENIFYQKKSFDRLLEIPNLLERNNQLLEKIIELIKNE